MATEIQKKERTAEIEGITIYGLAHGMWELFGDFSFATTGVIGQLLLDRMEQEAGLEINGEAPEHILTELVRLFTDEADMIHGGSATIEGDRILFSSHRCSFSDGSNALAEVGVQPFYCPIYNLTTAAMRARLDKRSRFISRKWDEETKTCVLEIQLMQ